MAKLNLSSKIKSGLILLLLSIGSPSRADFAVRPMIMTSIDSVVGDSKLKSRELKPIQVLQFPPVQSSLPSMHRFLIQGRLHGNEKLTTDFILWLVDRYRSGTSLLNELDTYNVAIDFLPIANPDGAAKNSRFNSRGVNLNRNFGVLWGTSRENPGSLEFSEPETQAIRKLFEARNYTASVDIHGYVNWVVAPSVPELVKDASDQRISVYKEWQRGVASFLPILGRYELQSAGGLRDGGAFEDWAFWDRGVLAICLEMQSERKFMLENGAPVDTFKRYEKFITAVLRQSIRMQQLKVATAN